MKIFAMSLVVPLLLVTTPCVSQGLTVTEAEGGSVRTDLGYNIVLNDGSSLKRRWFTIHDPALPADLQGTTGANVTYRRERSIGDFTLNASHSLVAREAVAAYEVRYLTFDMFGNPMRTLSTINVRDIAAGATFSESAQWRLYSESDAMTFHTSIAFVAFVRTADGSISSANFDAVLVEVRKINSKLTASDLEPKPAQN